MSVPLTNTNLEINGVLYTVTKSPGTGFWVQNEDQWFLLVLFNKKWYLYNLTDYEVPEFKVKWYVNVNPVYYPGDRFNINGKSYEVSEQLVGYHINFEDPEALIVDRKVWSATEEIEVYEIKEERESILHGPAEQILLKNMSLEEAKTYCHNFPSDNCNQELVKKIYGSDVITRRPKNTEVKTWIKTLLKFDPSSVENVLSEIRRMQTTKYRSVNLFMVLVDWYLTNKSPDKAKLKRDIFQSIENFLSEATPQFIIWLVDRGLNPRELDIEGLLGLYLKGEDQDEIIKTLEFLLDKDIKIKLDPLWRTGVPFGEEDILTAPNLDLRMLQLLDRFGIFNRYKNEDKMSDEISGLIRYGKFNELDYLIGKGYFINNGSFFMFHNYDNVVRENFYEWVNTRNYKLSDEVKRSLIQRAIMITDQMEAVELLEFVKSQGLPKNMIVYKVTEVWDKSKIYRAEGMVEDWFKQNGIGLDLTETIAM